MTEMGNSSSDVVLSYHDCLLRRSDVDLLKGPYWLNDAIVGFYFEHLDKTFQASHPGTALFVSPEMTQLLKMTDPVAYDALWEPLDVSNRKFIFFPLNDCTSRHRVGGSHWSLLVYSQLEKTCFHLDSTEGTNATMAKEFSKSVMDSLLVGQEGKFREVVCPKQRNGYDCGLFVLCFADVLSEYAASASKVEGCVYDEVESLVARKRESLLELIDKLMYINDA